MLIKWITEAVYKMKCPKCGNEIEENAKFCNFCGYKLYEENMTQKCNMNYYEILEITPEASQEVVKAAYRALVKKFHPDNMNGQQDECRTIEDVNMAYEVLSDPDRRKKYDAILNDENSAYKTEANYDKYQESDGDEELYDADDEETYGGLIAGSIASILTFGAFRYFEFSTWVLVVTGVAEAYFIGSLIGKIIVAIVKNICDTFEKEAYLEEKKDDIKGCCMLVVLQAVFIYLRISNWVTKMFMLMLIIAFASIIYSSIKLMVDHK